MADPATRVGTCIQKVEKKTASNAVCLSAAAADNGNDGELQGGSICAQWYPVKGFSHTSHPDCKANITAASNGATFFPAGTKDVQGGMDKGAKFSITYYQPKPAKTYAALPRFQAKDSVIASGNGNGTKDAKKCNGGK